MHQLQSFDELVHRAFCFQSATLNPLHPASFVALLEQVQEEAEKIRSVMLEDAFAHRSKKEMRLFVQTWQAVCIDLLDKVHVAAQTIEELPYNFHTLKGMINQQELVQGYLLSLLSFMENYFSRYFDVKQRMPAVYASTTACALKEKWEKVYLKLEDIAGEDLLTILSEPVKSFIEMQELQTGTYENLYGIKRYIHAMETVAVQRKETDLVVMLLEAFISINFCPAGFIKFYMKWIDRKPRMENPDKHAKEVLVGQLKLLNYFQPPSAGNDDTLPCVKSVVQAALEQEIQYLDNDRITAQTHATESNPEKILQTPLSVAQLALLVRLMVDSGTIKCDNQASLLRNIAASVRTDKTASISPESLRIKYYATDTSTASIVKEYVIKMMNLLRKYG